MMITVNSNAETNMRSVLMEMQSSGELCDFTIKSGVYSVRAHKCVLAATLQYFRTSFRFSESDTNETSLDLSHLNCDVEVIEKVVQSLYSQQIDVTEENVASILLVADYLMYQDLTIGIENFMKHTIEISTAALYFQLCLQYGFEKNQLFRYVCVLLSSRLHDYLIHQPSSLDWSVDVMEVMLKHNLFDHCTPFQMTSFILKKLEGLLLQAHMYVKDELNTMSMSILNFLEMYFTHLDQSTLNKWKTSVDECFDSWISSNSKRLSDLENVWGKVISIQKSKDDLCNNERTDQNNIFIQIPPSVATKASPSSSPLEGEIVKSYSCVLKGSDSVEVICCPLNHSSFANAVPPQSQENTNSNAPFDNSLPTLESSNSVQSQIPFLSLPKDEVSTSQCSPNSQIVESENGVISSDTFNGLVVLSPSCEMVYQLMEVEAGKAKPLLRAPQLSLHFYDVGLRLWRDAGILDFPVRGLMMEKHAWRMAFVNKSLFLFSLTKRKGLEYDTETRQWSELCCENLFKPHVNSDNDGDDNMTSNASFPIKSVIPVSMEDCLVIVSMSREPREDRSFWTQQHIYQWEPETRTFSHVTCVRDARMDLPATKWTVDGNDLVTVKASTMMFGDLQMFNIQHIHVYNAKLKLLETHHIDCPMKSGLKIFLQKKKLYLRNNFEEYRIYNLLTKELTDWIKVTNLSSYLNCGNPDLEIAYPAGIRTTCHAGSSRWTLNSNFNVSSASLSEVHVTENGEYLQRCHPNPPFQYMTSMCSAKLDKQQMASLDQAKFHLPTKQNQ